MIGTIICGIIFAGVAYWWHRLGIAYEDYKEYMDTQNRH